MLDASGFLTIQPAGDLRALDMFGRRAGQKSGDALIIPFNASPVYLLSDQMSVVEMQKRIAGARIEGLTAVNSSLYSLPAPLGATPTTLTARLQNQLNRPVKGMIALAGPKEWTITPAKQPFELAAAALGEVSFQVTATSSTAFNQYLVKTAIEREGLQSEQSQIVEIACMRPMTVTLDGKLDEWTTATFTRVDSEMQRDPANYMQWLAIRGSRSMRRPARPTSAAKWPPATTPPTCISGRLFESRVWAMRAMASRPPTARIR